MLAYSEYDLYRDGGLVPGRVGPPPTYSPEESACLKDRKWWAFLLSSIFTFLAGIFIVLIYRLIEFVLSGVIFGTNAQQGQQGQGQGNKQQQQGQAACESISASGNIFLGMTESPLLVKPFLPIMTKSELHAVLTGGFATIAGSVMAAYISFGISASHLLSASVMAAPSALALSKLLYPEVEVSKTTAGDIQLEKGSERNAIEAGSNGASTAVKLVANIMANLIAFMAFLAFLDAVLAWIGDMVDIPELSFKLIMSKLFIPLALMLGIEWADCEKIASLIGLKMVINEFVAYQELSTIISSGTISKRSETIATFALCSFANISSIGIQVGGLSSMAPSRKSDLAQLAVRAMITGSMASFMTACVAGMLS